VARMAAARPVAPTQPHLARLRVERQHRLIEELRLATGRHATAENPAAALRVDVRTVGLDISTTARSALTRLLQALHPVDRQPRR
jgi:hypothetical protein